MRGLAGFGRVRGVIAILSFQILDGLTLSNLITWSLYRGHPRV